VHLTTTLSPPTSLITLPSNCPSWGRTNSFRWDSLSTFLLPISKTYLYYPSEHVIKTYHLKEKHMILTNKTQIATRIADLCFQYISSSGNNTQLIYLRKIVIIKPWSFSPNAP
jgi:hypothetical protein